MRFLTLLSTAVTLSLVVAVPVSAGPVTGTPVGEPLATPTTGDQSESSADEREGQTASAPAFPATALFDSFGIPMLRFSAPMYLQLGERGKLRAQNQAPASFDSGSSFVQEALAGGGPPVSLGNVSVDPIIPVTKLPGVGASQAPEPATLLLLVPAAALLARRAARRSPPRA